jgi:hypothetical protein
VKQIAKADISFREWEMSSVERVCVTCGDTEEMARLERCGVCARYFCPDHYHRALGGRRFCSAACARNYYFHGEPDDDEDDTLTGNDD